MAPPPAARASALPAQPPAFFRREQQRVTVPIHLAPCFANRLHPFGHDRTGHRFTTGKNFRGRIAQGRHAYVRRCFSAGAAGRVGCR